MILAVNVGNTHVVFGLVDGKNVLHPVMNIKTDMNQTPYGYASEMKQILSLCGFGGHKIDGVIISSVVPPLTQTVKEAAGILTDGDVLTVGAGVKSGIHILTDDPGSVASDLVAAAVGAKAEYKLPCVIVDMGTAVTLTVVDGNGRFIGGAFLPGVKVSLSALAEEASLLPDIDVIPPKKAIASSTVECMRSGTIYGYAGAVDGIIDRFTAELGCEPETIITTGKIAELICSYTKRKTVNDSDLLLKGLGLIFDKNRR